MTNQTLTNQNKTKRNFGADQIKFLIASGAMAATMGLWSVFASRDHLANMQKAIAADPVTQQLTLDLGPLPTLVPFAVNGAVPAAAPVQSAQGLRQVSAPPQRTVNTNAPIVVSGNRSNSGPVTSGKTS